MCLSWALSAEVAHYRHTKIAGGTHSYRLGLGEVVTADAERAVARICFWLAADESFPACLDELLELGAACDARPLCDYDCPTHIERIKRWGRRWRLLDRGEVPDWITEGARRALQWRDTYPALARPQAPFELAGGGGGVALTEREEREIGLPALPAGPEDLPRNLAKIARFSADGAEFSFDPEADRAGEFKRALRALGGARATEACRRVDEIVALALERGGKLAEWKCEPEHFRWAARAVLGRESYERIAAAPVVITPLAVRKAVVPILRLIGLSRPLGRPRR